ncbi:hypothetical protein MIB92_12975 [Aestuariirhabdus sp. Z084]|uniref:hypothetical protein n=1 Tax=Aestuariirhabdus haliotis TaxID=2918751 RepID=UPI00201B3523|nr:hypothetical protein [Aestuariirhabdus haliotis]MCL6416565.1 hypothetical protein [Aestuariirhabdus haliotis]MCL6420568.1 hypothetical protein [Aestuariirhabdus haliotis]
MTADEYSQSIDWDEIYAAFHDPESVARRILGELDGGAGPVLFCGFPAVAAYLAEQVELVFIDSSRVITERARCRYPALSSIITGDVMEVLRCHPAKQVVISGRLSAFWQDQQNLEELAAALGCFERRCVLIDFFDRDAIYSNLEVHFEQPRCQGKERGKWLFNQISKVSPAVPAIYRANLQVTYNVGSTRCSYATTRAFFSKADIDAWCQRRLPDYQTLLSPPLLENDLGFLLKLIGRT